MAWGEFYSMLARRLTLTITMAGVLCAQPGPSGVTAHIGKGYELEQDDRFAEAAKEFREALTLDPRQAKARYQLAVCLFALGEYGDSRQEFERVRVEADNDPSISYYLARLDLVTGDSAAAIRGLAPLMSHPPFPDAAFYLGSAYLNQQRLDEAIKWLQRAAESDPRDFRASYRLARALQLKGLPEEAEREYARSTERREHYNESARQSVACVQALHKETAKAARDVCNRMFDASDPDKLTTLGILYGQNGEYEEAIRPLETAAKLDPDSFEVYHNLGLTYFRLRRFSEARAPLEKAVSLRPDFFGSNALLGATLYSLKEDDAAYRVLDLAHKLKPGDADTVELLFRVSVILGNKAVTARDYATGLRFLTRASELRPGNAELRSRIAEVKKRNTPR
jgi:tetratricopeptide (TPR) repeat protein